MATSDEAYQAIIDAVAAKAPGASPTGLLMLAEAYAWAQSPNNSHGGSTSS